jgi:dephospho-CoA kinase
MHTEGIKKPILIGLTGTYCAGKNHVARLLEERGLPVLDVDKLGHQVIEMEKTAIIEQFGTSIVSSDGTIDRKLLGAKVFGKPEALAALETIVHPGVNQLTDGWIDKQGENPCVINAALLHRSSAFNRLDCIILVKAPTLTRLLRARKRDNLSWGQLIKRFSSQKEFATQYLRKNADIYIVHNRGYLSFCSQYFRGSLEQQIDTIISLKGIVKVQKI